MRQWNSEKKEHMTGIMDTERGKEKKAGVNGSNA